MLWIFLTSFIIYFVLFVIGKPKKICDSYKSISNWLISLSIIITILLTISICYDNKYNIYYEKKLQGTSPLFVSDDGKHIINDKGVKLNGDCKVTFLNKKDFEANGNIEWVETYICSTKIKPCLLTKIITFSTKDIYKDSKVINYLYLERR